MECRDISPTIGILTAFPLQIPDCYLIFLMGETLPKPDREKWKGDIMNLLGIDDTYYKSKYKEPVSDFPSDSNREFAKEMRSIFR